MGHYCTLAPQLDDALAEAGRIFQQLQ
jgi:hypothetical protein